MKEGSYSLAFATNGQADEGQLQLKRNMLLGSTTHYRLSGQVVQWDGEKLMADVLVIPITAAPSAPPFRIDAVVKLTGDIQDGAFYLSGKDPNGVLVEMGCKWRSHYLDGMADA